MSSEAIRRIVENEVKQIESIWKDELVYEHTHYVSRDVNNLMKEYWEENKHTGMGYEVFTDYKKGAIVIHIRDKR